MLKRPFNTDAVYQAALADPAFLGEYSPRQKVQYWELISNLEQILEDMLDQGVMMESVFAARVRILEYAEKNNFARLFADRSSDEEEKLNKELIRKMMEQRMWRERKEYRSALEDVVTYRESKGYFSEDAFFCGDHRFHLNEKTSRVWYRACSLTIRQFLELQPRALLKF